MDDQQTPMSPDAGQAPPPPGAPQAPPPQGAPAGQPDQGYDDTGKLLSAGGYIFGIVAVIAILIEPYKNQRFVRHHAMQAIGLWVAYLIASVITAIPVIGWIAGPVLYLALLVVTIMGAIKAFQGQMWEMPVVYGIVQQYI